jgi:glycosyltransferase involved in cell wall biosynthesis
MMNARQTVLFISNHGDICGGGEISLLGLLDGLTRSQSWRPVLVVPEEGAVAVKSRTTGVPTSVIPMPALKSMSPVVPRHILRLARLIRTTGARLVHANGTRAMMYGGIAGKLARCPVVWHVRVMDSDGLLDRGLHRMATRVIVNSQAVRHRFNWAHAEKIHCIHNGIDTTHFAPRSPDLVVRASLNLVDDDRVVASVGRFVTYKGYKDLLHAWRQVLSVMPRIKLVLAGDGALRSELENLAETLGIAQHIRFIGWVEDVRPILALSELFILPSHGEHFGRVVIEAMAMGKAVVATKAGGIPEIVIPRETGLLVPPADPARLSEAILDLLSHPSQAIKYGEAGRRRVEAHFSLGQHVQAVEQIYQDVRGVCSGRM